MHLTEALLMSIHNICFGGEIRKTVTKYPLLSRPIMKPWIFGYPQRGDHYATISENILQYNLNGSNRDGSFTVDDSNSFFSPYKILPIVQENKYLGIFFLFYHGILCYVYSLELPHQSNSNEYTQHTIIV